MIDKTHSVTINRPVNEVFDYVADGSNEPEWHYDVKEVHRKSDGMYELGEKLRWVIKFPGGSDTYTSEVTALEPNRLIEITALEGMVLPVLTHTFQPEGNGTRYTRRVRFQPKGFLRVVAPLMGLLNNPNKRWAENLKALLEN